MHARRRSLDYKANSPDEPVVLTSYRLQVAEKVVFGVGKYANAAGKTECAEFVRQAAAAPQTIAWQQGVKVSDAKSGEIARGTAIATFDAKRRYPVDNRGKHAAIYLSHDTFRILVLDQWHDQGEVKERPIYFKRHKGTSRSNDADTFMSSNKGRHEKSDRYSLMAIWRRRHARRRIGGGCTNKLSAYYQ